MIYDITQNKLLLDTDFVFAVFTETDANHEKAIKINKFLEENNTEFIFLNLVKQELGTLISRRQDQATAIRVIEFLDNYNCIFITPDLEQEVWQVFKSFSKKNISFVDCANLAIAQKFKFKIASFDQFYPKEFLIK